MSKQEVSKQQKHLYKTRYTATGPSKRTMKKRAARRAAKRSR